MFFPFHLDADEMLTDLDLSNESWDTCVHLTSDCPGRGALCASAPGHLWTAVSCLSFLLWHPLSLHLSTPPPLFLPPSLSIRPTLPSRKMMWPSAKTARDHATVTVGCSVYTEIESNKSHEREKEGGGDGGKKEEEEKNQDESRRRKCAVGRPGWMWFAKAGKWSPSLLPGDVAGAHIHVDTL